MTEQTVVNLSDFTLNEYQKSILAKGLKFCPTPAFPDPGESREDLDNLHRRVRQIACFEGEDAMEASSSNESLDQTQNLNSRAPFKHRNFQRRSSGRGPPAPATV